MNSRRDFIKQALIATTLVGLSNRGLPSVLDSIVRISILHTNDVHSRIEPFPESDSRNGGEGGFARRAGIINKIRETSSNVLLFDSGDVFQGTPYFNKFGGELEFRLMSEMGYDAMTLGNHEFDNGLEGLVKALTFANFPIICTNYDFSETVLNNKTLPYNIYIKDDIKIGVLGIGIDLNGLVNSRMYGNMRYIDPIVAVNTTSTFLKNEQKCNYIICLSHLGLSYDTDKMSDVLLAKETKYIDLILGGHTHTSLERPYRFRNKQGKEVIICQAGQNGVSLGVLDLYFEKRTRKKLTALYTTKKNNNQV
ncbi:MAG: metallophosphoesterase [Bacteroidales bacterium]|nr:metallophosphoesterase [Bacteroidales bacterium]